MRELLHAAERMREHGSKDIIDAIDELQVAVGIGSPIDDCTEAAAIKLRLQTMHALLDDLCRALKSGQGVPPTPVVLGTAKHIAPPARMERP